MSRLTGNDAKEMLEAYQAVYAPQELTEEQVWEEVENWVHSLVDEGYDLSEYTWEEMYEAYSQLDEYAIPLIQASLRALPAIGAATKLLQGQGKSKTQEPVDYGQGTYFSSSKDKPAPKPSWEKPSTSPSGSSARLPSPAQPPAPKPPAQPPEPPAPKPPAQPPEPPAPKPPKPEGPNAAQRLLSSKARELRQSIGRGGKDPQGRGMTAAAGELIGSAVRTPIRQTLDVTKKVVTPLIAPAAGAYAAWKGATDLMNPETRAGRWIRGVRREDYEIIDIVKNYLIDNNYSDNEESALSIIENMSDEWIENILEAPELGSKNAQGKIYTGPKYGYQSWQTASSKRLLPSEVLGSEPPKAAAPKPKSKTPDQKRAESKAKLDASVRDPNFKPNNLRPGQESPRAQAPTAASKPAAQPPAPRQQAPSPAPRAQAPAPRPTVQPKIEKSPSGYAVGSVGGVKYERRAATRVELEAAQKARKAALEAAPKDIKGAELAAVKAGVGASKNPIKEKTMKYDAFDLVLEYLLSEGHTDTLDEALYVMMEMDPETIQSIYEAASEQSDKQIDKGVKTTYKAGNVLDNQHQGRSRGLNRLPATERAAKVERMRKRLKARRDDLFGERNKREDAAREEIRKKYGF